MKKSVVKMFLGLSLIVAFSLSLGVENAMANITENDGGKKGSSEVVQNTDDCPSGVSRMCWGDGTLCERTIGHDCVVN